MANEVKLQEGHPVDENLRPLKIGGDSTGLELSKNGVRANDLETDDIHVKGDYTNPLRLTSNQLITGILHIYGQDAIHVYDDGTKRLLLGTSNSSHLVYSPDSTDDYFSLVVEDPGKTTLSTVDADAASAHLVLNVDGDVILDPNSGITKFYIAGDTDDYFRIRLAASGATTLTTYDSDGAIGHIKIQADGHVEFDNCAVGFDRLEATFSATTVIESGGSHDTDIDFRLSNKYRLEITADIAQMNLIFPNTSGNFLIVCQIAAGGGGDHDVSAWKVWEHDSAAGSTNAAAVTDVMWAGGSVPAFTSGSATDIVSFYWDADEQTAYGVASLAFATP